MTKERDALKKMYQLLLTEPHAPIVSEKMEAIAKEALAQLVQETPFQIGQRLRQEGRGISELWGAVSSDADMPEAQRGFDSAAQPAQPDERNFCPRCGKRIFDMTDIHTCTPPAPLKQLLSADELDALFGLKS